jgi:menaquinol-cytochrome c reductase iron-sulfur subunit
MSDRASEASDRAEETRRSFLKLMTGVLSFFGALVVGVPLVGFVIGPALEKKKRPWINVAKVDALPIDEPVDLNFIDPNEDAFLRKTVQRGCWAVRHSPTAVTVFSPICPHLGCRYDWLPQRQQFVCPCHGSVFALDGKVIAGPAPRPLDTLPTEIRNGEILVEWERFKLGIPSKVVV